MRREIILVDAHLGNLDSVERALVHVGATVVKSSDPDRIAAARALVFPGQSAFSARTDALVEGALGAAIRMVIERGDPFLGICLGMQLLFDRSEEDGGHPGLGVLPGVVRRLPADQRVDGRPLKVPHIGWSDVQPTGEHFYFAHSYYAAPEQPDDLMWTARYGQLELAAAVRRGSVYGAQFHPEKSQLAGLRFLRSFILGGRA
ncbi:MAG: imidazole glycerol phosphate synthase subunit HisH [Nannocystis sp.]|nr:imidazole glycerol phosphate synthase subunit HisH [Nannocystis sp.]